MNHNQIIKILLFTRVIMIIEKDDPHTLVTRYYLPRFIESILVDTEDIWNVFDSVQDKIDGLVWTEQDTEFRSRDRSLQIRAESSEVFYRLERRFCKKYTIYWDQSPLLTISIKVMFSRSKATIIFSDEEKINEWNQHRKNRPWWSAVVADKFLFTKNIS